MQDNQQQPPTPASSRALNIPEILMAIGEQFYLVSESRFSQWATNKSKIISLVACIQVSKLWFRTFHPILWYSYNPCTISHFSQHSISTNTPHFRKVHIIAELWNPLDFTQLVTLELVKSYTGRRIVDLPLERQLVRTNPGLRTLVWEGPQTASFLRLQKDDFTELKCVRELVLYRWNNNNLPFIEILRPMAGTLMILKLRHISHFSVSNLMNNNDSTSTLVTLPRLETILIDTYRYEHARRITPSVVQELVVASPNLRTLGLKLHQDDDQHGAMELATCLREFCPYFQELMVHCIHDQLWADSTTTAPTINFIRYCSASGLTKLTIWDAPWHDNKLFLSIISHARTLKDLEISWAVEGYTGSQSVDGARCILQLLTQCHQLRSFVVTDVPMDEFYNVFDLWKSQEWGCKRLVTFGIKFATWDGDDDDADLHEDGNDEEVEQISGTNPVMGWYLHSKNGTQQVLMGTVKYLFRMLEGKESIQMLIVDKYAYRRSSVHLV
ncbi:hypothetical protein BGZ96_001571 [Linnemannia gamsii]|uniref:F-box domain-containing protein n=1 Tax=Linnemannia gamsii TaxID=64522 RepID=A0ABQ7JM47_9FUNG|nr:hypothetical protein BGZ96_001571 [Linnemannia gamsii]